jgi:hypothetical protein
MEKNIFKKIINDGEYRVYLILIILSALTALVEHLGFVFSHSNTLNVGVGHMLLHSSFFISGLILTLIQRGDIKTRISNLDKKIYYISIGLIILFLGYRFNEMIGSTIEMLKDPNHVVFRTTAIISLFLIAIQSYILHARKFTCSIICHGALLHLGIDVIGFMALFAFSFTNRAIFASADFFIFWITGGLIVISIISKFVIDLYKRKFKR